MSKFKKKANTSQEIPTSALPDIIFMLLFFFMVTTVLRETTINVEQKIPDATELRKLQRKSLVSYIYVGKPTTKLQAQFGTEPLIQVNDAFKPVDALQNWVMEERAKLDENEKDQLTVALKVDKEAKMGLINDVQIALREADARKLMYTTIQEIQD